MNEIDEIIQTIQALRDQETGCPWDREQTMQSLLKPLKNETEELEEAIDTGDRQHIAEELGDVVWNALMLLEAASSEGIADKDDILSRVNEKMIDRHPHVFGKDRASTKEEALKVYERAKREQIEKQQNA